jgi:hypothetical protein
VKTCKGDKDKVEGVSEKRYMKWSRERMNKDKRGVLMGG